MAKETINVTEFGESTIFDGHLSFSGQLVISGKFTGTIDATGNLELSKTSECVVDKMTAKSVVIYGNVTGDITGDERVELCKGSRVKGNIITSNLRVADNVEFDGSIDMLESDEARNIDLFALSSDEFRRSLVLKSSRDNN